MTDIILTPNPETPPPPPPPPIQSKSAGSSKAILSLVLGILSLICCGFFSGIPAIILGKSEMKAVDSGLSDPSNRALAMIGFILGIVGTVLGVAFYLVIIIGALVAGRSIPTTF